MDGKGTDKLQGIKDALKADENRLQMKPVELHTQDNECDRCGFVLHNCVCSHADYEDD